MSNKDAHQVINMLLTIQMGLSRCIDESPRENKGQSQVIAHVDLTGTELLPKTPYLSFFKGLLLFNGKILRIHFLAKN